MAFLNKPPRFKDNNTVALLNGSETMCDDNGGSLFHDIVKGDLDLALRFFIES
jgi:hypothetical protein